MSRKGKLVAEVAIAAMIATFVTNAAAAQTPDDKTQGEAAKKVEEQKKKAKDQARESKRAKKAAAITKADESQPKISNESGRLEGDIVVVGLRENVKSARAAKRHAQQIVDVVVAQDIGKLPDKNVAEALARVPGVQIDRNHGEGGTIKIRGLDGVMTTVNGSPTFSAGDRTTYLQDISSDLVAAIEVYKTRTPDQVEGSQTGVVNLTMRRPTDFKHGATYSFNIREDYADQVKIFNPYYTALIAYNADTSLGKIGFTLSGTYNKVNWNESLRYNALPTQYSDTRAIVTPSTLPANIYLPYQIGFAGTNGWSRRAALSASTQWRPDDHWSITLEGGYNDQRMYWGDNVFDIPVTYTKTATPSANLSNIVMGTDGRLVKSLSLYGLDPVGPGRASYLHHTLAYNARFQVEYRSDRFEFNTWLNYNRSDNDSNNLFHWIRFNQQPALDVIFNDTSDPKGGPNVRFKNVDLLDKNNYLYVDGIDQTKQFTYSGMKEFQADLRLNTFWNLLDWFKVGVRYADRSYDRQYGRRAYGELRIPMSSLPDYHLVEAGPLFPSAPTASTANWLIGDSKSIRSSWSLIRNMAQKIHPDLSDPYPTYDPFQAFHGSETTYAGYGMLHYTFKLLFPIEGTLGARLVNTVTGLTALQRTTTIEKVDGQYKTVYIDKMNTPKSNMLVTLPSLNAIIHITSKLQLRTSYSYDVGRPTALQLNPALYLDARNVAQAYARGGNANLGPVKKKAYDASLEWYFGATGSISLAAWQWDQDGLVADRTYPEYLAELPDAPTLVTRPYNFGKGRHRGIEGAATTFFTFLPGILKSFGGSVNGTLNITHAEFPSYGNKAEEVSVSGPYLWVSKYIYNLVGFYERNGLNVRVAYNWRSRQQVWRDAYNPYNNIYIDPIERLDASINYDINKHLTVALEGSNLTRNGDKSYFGSYDVPRDVRYFSRNFSFSVRAKL